MTACTFWAEYSAMYIPKKDTEHRKSLLKLTFAFFLASYWSLLVKPLMSAAFIEEGLERLLDFRDFSSLMS